VTLDADGTHVSRHGRWDVVDTAPCDPDRLPDRIIAAAGELLGLRPRGGIACSFDGPPGESDSWPTVVDIAKAVAAEVPLAVLDDHAGTTYLVHPGRGLIGPAEIEAVRRDTRPSTADLLRRMLGGPGR
jgi:hypothetical protein